MDKKCSKRRAGAAADEPVDGAFTEANITAPPATSAVDATEAGEKVSGSCREASTTSAADATEDGAAVHGAAAGKGSKKADKGGKTTGTKRRSEHVAGEEQPPAPEEPEPTAAVAQLPPKTKKKLRRAQQPVEGAEAGVGPGDSQVRATGEDTERPSQSGDRRKGRKLSGRAARISGGARDQKENVPPSGGHPTAMTMQPTLAAADAAATTAKPARRTRKLAPPTPLRVASLLDENTHFLENVRPRGALFETKPAAGVQPPGRPARTRRCTQLFNAS